jgi:hypothetical protein
MASRSSFLSHFEALADESHCCAGRRRSRLRGEFRLDGGRHLHRNSTFSGGRGLCESLCRAHDRCSHYSFSSAGRECALCEGCFITDAPRVSSWRRMGRFSATASVANASIGSWGTCRFDHDAVDREAGTRRRCRYKTEIEASLSMAGKAWEYYHFLVDLAPRILSAMLRDDCDAATLAAPGWSPQHLHGTFALAPIRAKDRHRNASVADHARVVFPRGGLQIVTHSSRQSLCDAPGKYLPFQPAVFDWSRQPAIWLDALRGRVLPLARLRPSAPLPSPATATTAAGVLLIRRRAENRRRTLPPGFFANASAFLRGHELAHSIASLEGMPLLEQARLFASPAAHLVVGLHGAGLSNLIFSPSGAAVLEVYTAAFPCYRQLAHRRGVHYRDHAYGFMYAGPLYFDRRLAARLTELMGVQGGWTLPQLGQPL